MSKEFQSQIIQFTMSTQFSSIWPMDMIQRGTGSGDNEGVLRILQSSSLLEPHH